MVPLPMHDDQRFEEAVKTSYRFIPRMGPLMFGSSLTVIKHIGYVHS
jgi:hypothetical protein